MINCNCSVKPYLSSLRRLLYALVISHPVVFFHRQIDLGSVRKVGKIATKGRRSTGKQMYVKNYIIRYSKRGIVFTSFLNPFNLEREKVIVS